MTSFLPIEDDITFSVLGSNHSVVAMFGSTIDSAYTQHYALENSNLVFQQGVSNVSYPQDPNSLRWTLGINSNNTFTPTLVIRGGNVGIGSFSPTDPLVVQGNATIYGNIHATNLAPSAFTDTTIASNITSGTLANARLPSAIAVATLAGDGASLSNLHATYITTGTLANARLPSAIAVTTLAGDGASLSNLHATYITTGTLDNARLPAAISVSTFAGDGASLSNLHATYITTGTLDATRLATSGVAAGTYGSASAIPIVTVDTKGRVTYAETSNVAISAGAVSGLATVATTGDYNSLSNISFVRSTTNTYYTEGNVGIGTSASFPNRLDVLGSVAVGSYAGTTTAPANSMIISGQLGVGTAFPAGSSKLHVIGDIVSSGTIIASNMVVLGEYVTLNTVTSNTENMIINNSGTGPAFEVIQTGAEDIARFMDDSNVAMLIADGGRIGINTASPIHALDVIGNIKASASVLANAFSGDGASLSNLNATYLTTGTVANARLPSAISVATFSGDGASLSNLNATYITSGTIANARLPSAISVATFSGDGASLSNLNATYLTTGTVANARLPSAISVTSFSGDGASLSNLNATYLTTGTVANARLPPVFNINTSSQTITVNANGNVGIGTTDPLTKLQVQGGIYAAGAILPTSCNTFDLGSSTLRWKDLYLSGSSIDIEGTRIAKDLQTGGVKFVDANGSLLPARSSNMMLNGKLAVNASTQSSTLAVAGNAMIGAFTTTNSNMDHPPSAMTSNVATISGITYITSASSTLYPGTDFEPYKAFNKQPPNTINGEVNQWLSGEYYNATTGVYQGSTQTTVSGATVYGEWLQLQISNPIILNEITQYGGGHPDSSPPRFPKKFTIAGSTDGVTWTTLLQRSNQKFPGLTAPVTYTIPSTTISYLRFIVEATTGPLFGMYAQIAELVLTSYKVDVPNVNQIVTVNNIGYIGIGTDAPQHALHVMNGNAVFSSNVTANSVIGNSFVGSGASLSNLNADYIATGNVPNARLPAAFNVNTTSQSLTIDTTGNIGIGTTSPNYKLQVQGKIFAADSITAYSDARVKTNVETISDALHLVRQMRGVQYERVDTGEKQIGVIAQEVQALLPSVVTEANNGLSVAYGNMVGLLIEAIKELHQKVEFLEDQLQLRTDSESESESP